MYYVLNVSGVSRGEHFRGPKINENRPFDITNVGIIAYIFFVKTFFCQAHTPESSITMTPFYRAQTKRTNSKYGNCAREQLQ